MNKLLSTAAFIGALSLACASAIAATPGVDDTVSYIKASSVYPNCILFQTVNAGGVIGRNAGAPYWYSIGTGAGANALGPLPAADALQKVTMSRVFPSLAPPLQFVLINFGYYGDCPANSIGVNPIDW